MSDLSSASSRAVKVGILSPGEMGAALGALLSSCGHDVVSTVSGRSERTTQLGRSSGLKLLPGLSDVVREADVIISVVTPQAAVSIAEEVAAETADQTSHGRPAPLIYADANSVAPHTAQQISDVVCKAGAKFADVTVHGLASRLETQGTVFVSGSCGDAVADLFAPVLCVRCLGTEPGQASLMKMLLGGMSKGIIGLFVQSAALAASSGMNDAFCQELENYFPDVLNFVKRSLPTCPTHAPRRATEMAELKDTLDRAQIRSEMAQSAATVFGAMAGGELRKAAAAVPQPADLNHLIEVISETQKVSSASGRVNTAC